MKPFQHWIVSVSPSFSCRRQVLNLKSAATMPYSGSVYFQFLKQSPLSLATSYSSCSLSASSTDIYLSSILISSATFFLIAVRSSSYMFSPLNAPVRCTTRNCWLSSCLKSCTNTATISSWSLILKVVSPLPLQSFIYTIPSLRAIMARVSVYPRQVMTLATGWLDLAFHLDFLLSQQATVPSSVPTSTPSPIIHMLVDVPAILPQSQDKLTPLYLTMVRSPRPSTTSFCPLFQKVHMVWMLAEQWLTNCSSPWQSQQKRSPSQTTITLPYSTNSLEAFSNSRLKVSLLLSRSMHMSWYRVRRSTSPDGRDATLRTSFRQGRGKVSVLE